MHVMWCVCDARAVVVQYTICGFSLARSLAHSLTRPLTHSLAHSLTLSLSHMRTACALTVILGGVCVCRVGLRAAHGLSGIHSDRDCQQAGQRSHRPHCIVSHSLLPLVAGQRGCRPHCVVSHSLPFLVVGQRGCRPRGAAREAGDLGGHQDVVDHRHQGAPLSLIHI